MRERRDLIAAGLFLALALGLGGTGPRYPFAEMLVQIGGLALILHLIFDGDGPVFRGQPRLPLLLIGSILLLPLLQLIPLPPEIWTRLPGRAAAVEATQLGGLDGIWRPLSLDPEATRRSLLALLPGVAMGLATMRLSAGDRWRLLWIVLAFALFGVFLGALQLASGDGSGVTPFPSAHQGYAVGLFVNRNHQASFLLIGLIVAAASAAGRMKDRQNQRQEILVALALISILGFGAVVTASRTGTALLPLALAFAFLILLRGRLSGKAVGAAAGALILVALLLSQNAVIQRTLARFSSLDDARFLYWQDVFWSLDQYRWAGSGFGSFPVLHQVAESLDSLAPRRVNHAHNDYLELAMEGGAPALLVAALFLLFVLVSARRLLLSGRQSTYRLPGLVGLGGVAIILLHSVVDYPLRMLAIETLFGLLCGLLVIPVEGRESVTRGVSPDQQHHRDGRRRRHGSVPIALGRLGLLAVAVTLVWQIVTVGQSARAMLAGRYAQAVDWAPWSAKARGLRATELLIAGELPAATVQARKSLAISPINQSALRTLGMAAEEEGQEADATALMLAAGRLGWRDNLTQLWLMQRAIDSGDARVAVERADALLRRNVLPSELLAMLRSLAGNPPVRAALADRLVAAPWRKAWFASGRDAEKEEAPGFAAVMLRLKSTAAPTTLREARPLLNRLAETGELSEAHGLWVQLGGAVLLHDGSFENWDKNFGAGGLAPFEWHPHRILGVTFDVSVPAPPAQGTALHINSDGMAVGAMLSQRLLLPPGRYLFSVLMREDEAGMPTGLTWELGCERGPPMLSIDIADTERARKWIQTSGPFVVPDRDCRVQQLRLRSTEASGSARSFWIDEAQIRKAGG